MPMVRHGPVVLCVHVALHPTPRGPVAIVALVVVRETYGGMILIA